jgi:hypothetical protein
VILCWKQFTNIDFDSLWCAVVCCSSSRRILFFYATYLWRQKSAGHSSKYDVELIMMWSWECSSGCRRIFIFSKDWSKDLCWIHFSKKEHFLQENNLIKSQCHLLFPTPGLSIRGHLDLLGYSTSLGRQEVVSSLCTFSSTLFNITFQLIWTFYITSIAGSSIIPLHGDINCLGKAHFILVCLLHENLEDIL